MWDPPAVAPNPNPPFWYGVACFCMGFITAIGVCLFIGMYIPGP